MTRREITKDKDANSRPAELPASPDSKSPSDSALLAQELATNTSWAERYVPSTPSETVMTPTEPDVEPPSYDESVGGSVAGTDREVRAPVQELPAQPEPRRWQPQLNYTQHEKSQSIRGTFTLHDSLELTTESGSIDIKLDVKPGRHPAILKLTARSGSIRVVDQQCDVAQGRQRGSSQQSPAQGFFSALFGSSSRARIEPPPTPQTDDPRKQPGQHVEEPDQQSQLFGARAIHASIETTSGSINAELIICPGAVTRVSTNSASINLRLVTAHSEATRPRTLTKAEQEDGRNAVSTDLASVLTTKSSSGSQNVHINHGFGVVSSQSDADIISACRAKFLNTGSGSMGVYYPKNWYGLVHTSMGGSGSMNVYGSDLQYDRRGNREIYAWRGTTDPDENKAVELRCDGSGSLTFNC